VCKLNWPISAECSLEIQARRSKRKPFLIPLGSLLLASSLVLGSCATIPKNADPKDSLLRLQRNCELRKAISGTAFFTSKVNGKSVSAPAVILAKWPDRLRIELQDPAGGLLGLMVFAEGKFWFYQHDRPEILTGSIRSFPSEHMAGVSATDLVRVFLARPPFEKVPVDAVRNGEANFHLGPFAETIRWDEKTLQPLQWVEVKGDGSSSLAEFGDYEFRQGAHYPRLFSLKQGERQSIVSWREWEPSVPEEKKLFQIPQQQTFGRKIKALP
jgi:outer membrane lipoprotein-sorting protein